ncbi:MAG: hypothetical protein WBD95_02945, partial [Xanthobacteraceae bacterium]
MPPRVARIEPREIRGRHSSRYEVPGFASLNPGYENSSRRHPADAGAARLEQDSDAADVGDV